MKRRVFVAINLPEDVKKKLADYQLKWPELPCRWTKKDNLHLTLEFLGYLTDEKLLDLCQKTKKVASAKNPFTVSLNKICYGPTDKKPVRMVWAVGERINELNIKPHITLGRLKMFEFKQIEPEERPEINEEINLTFEVNSMEIMESRLKRGGAEYIVLQSYELSN